MTFIGDSITEGASAGNRMTQSYSARFLENAVANGKDVIVSNLGVSAAGMMPSIKAGSLRYYPEMLAYPIALGETDADYFVFALGTNDANHVGTSNGAAEEYYNSYKAFIKACGDLPDTEKVFVTTVLLRNGSGLNYNIRTTSVVRPLQKKIAADLAAVEPDKYVLVDLYALTYDAAASGNFLSSDNLHPTANGHVILGKIVYDAIYGGVCEQDGFAMTDVYLSDSGKTFGAGTKEDPTSSLAVALGKCAPNATIHIVGTSSWSSNVDLPHGMESLTIVGEGKDAVWNLSSSAACNIRVGSKLKIDNLRIRKTDNKGVIFIGQYNSVELTESFSADTALQFYAGYAVQAQKTAANLHKSAYYDTETSASSDKDCAVVLNGGNFTYIMGGNRRYAADSPYGIYSGNMTIHVGGNATVSSADYSGMCGMNYLAGSITAEIDRWAASVTLKEYAKTGTLSGVAFDPMKNTGSVTVKLDSSVKASCAIVGDFNGDGKRTVEDARLALGYVLSGKNPNPSAYFEQSRLRLGDVLLLLRQTDTK